MTIDVISLRELPIRAVHGQLLPRHQPRRLSVALVGLGRWGRNHFKALIADEAVKTVWVFDPAARIEALTSQANGKLKLAGQLEDCLDKVDLAIVATPVASHPMIAEAFLRHRIPTFVEKPLASTSTQCAELYQLAKGLDVFLGVGFQYRFHPATTSIMSLIELYGLRGTTMCYRSERIQGLRRPNVDVILDLAIHDIALAIHFFDLSVTSAVIETVRLEDDGTLGGCRFELNFGAIHRAHILVDWHGVKLRRFSLEADCRKWCVDEVEAPGFLMGPGKIGDGMEISSIPDGASLALQQTWLLEKADDGCFCQTTASFNERVMNAVTLVQTAVSIFLQEQQDGSLNG